MAISAVVCCARGEVVVFAQHFISGAGVGFGGFEIYTPHVRDVPVLYASLFHTAGLYHYERWILSWWTWDYESGHWKQEDRV